MTTPDLAEARRLWPILSAMAHYTAHKHRFDDLDARACTEASLQLRALADELERLRAQVAPAGLLPEHPELDELPGFIETIAAAPAQQAEPRGYDLMGQLMKAQEQRDELRQALEVIALGDAADPVRDAGDTLVDLGWWGAEALAASRAEANHPAQGVGLLEAATEAAGVLTFAARDVLLERQRQISAEGWTPEHDDEHKGGGMATAAAVYCIVNLPNGVFAETIHKLWSWTGWAWKWFKPKDRRSNLVRAGALILAEIERLDRADTASRQAAAAPWIA